MSRILRISIFFALAVAAAEADTIQLMPGALKGAAGDTVGWGFTITSTPVDFNGGLIVPWSLVTFADFVPDAGSEPVGVFSPFITQLPNRNTVIGADAGNGEVNPWTQPFDAGAETGIGSYVINDFQMPGDQVIGSIVLYYDVYSVSPEDSSFDPGADIVALGQTMSARASVTVAGQGASAPEPSTIWLATTGFVLLTIGRSG